MDIERPKGASATRGTRRFKVSPLGVAVCAAGVALCGCGTKKMSAEQPPATAESKSVADETSPAVLADGQRIFRFDTFGDEEFWTDQLGLHQVVEKNVDPTTALKVGLKVDADVLPSEYSRRST
jgi:hypothetical protein